MLRAAAAAAGQGLARALRPQWYATASPTVVKSHGNGNGGNLEEDLKMALAHFEQSKPRVSPPFIVAVISNYHNDLTEKTLAKVVKDAGVNCPIIGCQARGIRGIRRGGKFAQPRVTCFSLKLGKEKAKSASAWSFFQSHTSTPDMERWSGKTMGELVLEEGKQPFTFAFASPDIGTNVRDLVKRNANIFSSSISAVPKGPTADLFFVANARNAGKRTHMVASSGIVGLGIQSDLTTSNWLNLCRQILSSHWWSGIFGCQTTAQGLFVPKVIRSSSAGKTLTSRPSAYVHKYKIAQQALGIPMFPINGACLYPATEMTLRIFEPRYRAMVKQSLENTEVFGIIPRSDRNKLDCIGTIAYIKEVVEMTKSGESTIVIQGLRRFKFKKGGSLRMQPGSFGLNFADIEFFDDQRDEGEGEEDSETYATIDGFGTELQILHQRAARWLGGDHHATSPQDMSFLLADALPAPQNLKMRWLKSMSTTERLNETIEFLSKM